MDSRLVAVFALAYLLVANLQGCGNTPSPAPSPSPKAQCYEEVDSIAIADTVYCNKTKVTADTPVSTFHYFIGQEGLVQFTYQLNPEIRYKTQSAADIKKSENGYVLTLHPPAGSIGQTMCIDVAVETATGIPKAIGVRTHNFTKCPSCSSPTDSYDAYSLVLQSSTAGLPCPSDVTADTSQQSAMSLV